MKIYLILLLTISIFSCSEDFTRLDESKRNYIPLDQIDFSSYQSDDLFLLNELSFGSISQKIKTFNDSVLGIEWSEKIADNLNDSLVRNVFLFKDNSTKRKLYQLDSTERYYQDDSPHILNLSGDNIISNEGDSFIYFTYKEYDVSMTFRICFEEPIIFKKGRVYDLEVNENDENNGKYRNFYLVDLNFIIDYRISAPQPFIGSPEVEYYRLVINDRCTLLRNEFGDDLSKD